MEGCCNLPFSKLAHVVLLFHRPPKVDMICAHQIVFLFSEPPSFVKPMENKEIIAGEPIVLECMASGSPKPKLTWRKDGKDLVVTERHFFTADDQLLVIVDTDLSDAGAYECQMSNALGTEHGISQLSVIPGERVADFDHRGSREQGSGVSCSLFAVVRIPELHVS